MNPWVCALYISIAGAVGGIINSLMTDSKIFIPRYENGILCPGIFSNILIGAVAAFISWTLYGSGAGMEIAKSEASPRQEITLTMAALGGALLIGIAGAKWLTSEIDKRVYKAGILEASKKNIDQHLCEEILQHSPREILKELKEA